jgi:hypothetical protein
MQSLIVAACHSFVVTVASSAGYSRCLGRGGCGVLDLC